MAKALILSCHDASPFDVWKHSSAFLLKHSSEVDKFRKHTLTDDPAEADIILFAEMGTCGKFAELVRAHPFYRRYRGKCFLFDSGDLVFPTLPGIYASLTTDKHRPGFTRTGFYLYMIENAFINSRPCSGSEKYLASFVGSKKTHPVRNALFQFGRNDIYTKDTSSYSTHMMYHGAPEDRRRFWLEYADSIANAKFSLCPRGAGAGSIRLFESMKMGRACVILSDAWQPDEGVNWDDFSIRVAERDAPAIPEILDRHEQRAVEMGARARKAWEERFSEQARFHTIVELCLEMLGRGSHGTMLRTLQQTANPKNLRRYLSSKRDLHRNTGRIYW